MNAQKALKDGSISKEDYAKELAKIDQWKKGDLLVQTDLANTLKRIAKNGSAGFYEGETAELIIQEMNTNDGFITKQDLLNYDSVYRNPVQGTYRGNKVISMGPPSSGGALLIQMLNMIENFDIKSMERNSSRFVHLLTEVQRLAYADRAIHLGDPDFWPNPIPMLTSKDYAKERLSLISMDSATRSTEIAAGKALSKESVETTHYSVMDNQGNVVGITTTLNMSYGSKKVVDGAGFLLNNEMDDFSSKPGSPNTYGLIGSKANAIEPCKRMLSSMTPTIIEKKDDLFLVLGSPGGSTIITSVFQTILNVIHFEMDIMSAVNYPRFHHQWKPEHILMEKELYSKSLNLKLNDLGHNIKTRKSIGNVNAIMLQKDSVSVGPDKRGDNTAQIIQHIN